MATVDSTNHSSTNGVQKGYQEEGSSEIIDDDILHTVDKLFHVRPHHSHHKKGHNPDIEEIVKQALQAERNHWKSRLHTAMQEIDRQHKVILTAQSGLQEILRLLRPSLQRSVIMEDEEEEADMENTAVIHRLLENAKFQIRQLKLKAGMGTASRLDYEDTQNKQRNQIIELKDKLKATKHEHSSLEQQLAQNSEKLQHLQKENNSLHKQLTKLQKIVQKYNENHNGASFHLNNVDQPISSDRKLSDKRMSMTTCDVTETTHRSSHRKERTYVEGDQLVSYPLPVEENAIIKDRLKKNIYSARKGDSRSSNVAQCLRCQGLFKPAENTHRSCRFHHKGREITEQFDDNGKLGKVTYKWACCKKPLETQGCCYGYHM